MLAARCFATAALVAAAAVVGSQERSAATVFASDAVLRMRLDAPLQTLFTAYREKSGNQVTGALTYYDEGSRREVTLRQVVVSVRGNTSTDPAECTFPKLKLRFPKNDAAVDASIFRGMTAIRIGTHCADRPDRERTPKGRLANEKAPRREAAVYQLLAALGVTSLKARAADVTYVDGQETIRRGALILEDVTSALPRLAADREIDKSEFTNARDAFARDDAARLAFGEALVGNFDWCVKWTADDRYRCDAKEILWNVAVLARSDGSVIPLMYDFDVAGMVVGRHGWFPRVFDEAFVASGSAVEVEVLSQVQRTRSLFSRALLDATRKHFVDRKSAGYKALERSTVDADGKALIRAYMDAFFGAIETDEAFYRPVVVMGRVTAFADRDRQRRFCEVAVPSGTVVAEAPTSGQEPPAPSNLIRVRLLDVLWRWAMNKQCDGLRHEAVWIERKAISTNYPAR